MCVSRPGHYYALDLCDPDLRKVFNAGGPVLTAYDAMAGLWQEYSHPIVRHYPTFLAALARDRGITLDTVLDLACGTGSVTAPLAETARRVVGVDASAAMLERAKSHCLPYPHVELVRGDFTSFHLEDRFDAAVCAFNSLNYVPDPGALVNVFRSVAAHLKPGGLFVCDTITGRGMRLLSGLTFHGEAGRKKFAIRFRYDAGTRRETSMVVLAEGLEVHNRVPLDLADVQAAAAGAGLVLKDYFYHALIPRWLWTGPAGVFVLTKPT